MSGRKNLWSSVVLVCVSLGAYACAGGIETPSDDGPGVRARGGSSGRGGTGGRSNTGGRSGSAGRGGSNAVPEDAGAPPGGGSSGGNSEDPPDSGSGGGGVVQPRVYCDAYTEVFRVSCGPSCHQNVGVPIGDFGYEPDSARAYINRVSVRNAECGLIIDPNNPLESLILTKVTGAFERGNNCGAQMPVGSLEITDEQIDCLADWVQQFGNE